MLLLHRVWTTLLLLTCTSAVLSRSTDTSIDCKTLSGSHSVKTVHTTTVARTTSTVKRSRVVSTSTVTSTVTPDPTTTTTTTVSTNEVDTTTTTTDDTSTITNTESTQVTSGTTTTVVPTSDGFQPVQSNLGGCSNNSGDGSNDKRNAGGLLHPHGIARRALYPTKVTCSVSYLVYPSPRTHTVLSTTTVMAQQAVVTTTTTDISQVASTHTEHDTTSTTAVTTTTQTVASVTSTTYAACQSNNVVGPTFGGDYIDNLDTAPFTVYGSPSINNAIDCCNICFGTGDCKAAVWIPTGNSQKRAIPPAVGSACRVYGGGSGAQCNNQVTAGLGSSATRYQLINGPYGYWYIQDGQ